MGSALDSASLIMYPSGYSDGVLGSAKPTDGSGDFTFTRGSNLSATRVGPNGYIEKGYENLLLQSNSFDTSPWIQYLGASGSVLGNQTGHDGSSDAWLLNSGYAGGFIEQDYTDTSLRTLSIYAKKGSTEGIAIVLASNTATYFDLNNGNVVQQNSSAITAKSTNAGNGWWRVEISTNQSTHFVRIYPATGGSTSSGSIYIQDAMLNQGLVAYPYIETTTAPVAGGILEDEPRIDFSDGCGHLLLEPQRTNAVAHSEYLNGLAITTMNITPNATTSPEGVDNASLLLATNNAARVTSDYNSVTAGQKINVSAYIKNINCTNLVFYYFDVQNGIAIASDNLADELSTEEWRRINYTFTAPQTSSRVQFQFCRIIFNGQSLYAYGLQAEQDATYPTSYIPTYGSSSTRLADDVDIPSSADLSIPSDSWTILWDISDDSVATGGRWVNDSLNNINLYPTTPNKTRFYWRGIGQYIALGGGSKVIARYDGTTATEFHDGVNKGSASYSGQLPFDFRNEFQSNSGKYLINKIVIFPTALSDDECIALTTI